MRIAEFDPASSALEGDPIAYYRDFREVDPVHCNSRGFWFLTSYEGVTRLLKDPQGSTDSRELQRRRFGECSYVRHVEENLFFRDGEEHRRLRSFFSRAFTSSAINRLKPRIWEIAQDLVRELDPSNFDVMSELAEPLPVAVIAELLGVPARYRKDLSRWSAAVTKALEPHPTEDIIREASVAVDGMSQLLRDVLHSSWGSSNSGLLIELAQAGRDESPDGDQLTEAELIHNAMFLLSAGHETTTTLIGSGVRELVGAPEQYEKLQSTEGLEANAVEELLRMVSPIQMTVRTPLQEIEVSGRKIPEGAIVFASLGAANRDPSVFADPNVLDLQRENARRNVAFGQGSHTCLGAPLARIEARICFRALVDRFRELVPVGDMAEGPQVMFRRLSAYHLKGVARF